MKLLFVLSMPSNNSWNGRWRGEENFYGRVVNIGTAKKRLAEIAPLLARGYFTYSFGDGWVAGVTVTEASAADRAKVKRSSRGFCGYDWMIDSLLRFGAILNDEQKSEIYRRAYAENPQPRTKQAASELPF